MNLFKRGINQLKVIVKESITELEITKSKFIAHVKPVANEEEAKEFIQNIKKLHRKASHNVPVYLLGNKFEVQRYSDDGEPSGTAGLPVLRMLMNEEVSNLVVVITRYFGGIKLGKGGLVRAYTMSAKKGIEASGLSEVLCLVLVEFELDYNIQNKFIHALESSYTYYEKSVEYTDVIKYSYYLPQEDVDSFEQFMIELTSGDFVFLQNTKVEAILLDGKIKEVTCIEKF